MMLGPPMDAVAPAAHGAIALDQSATHHLQGTYSTMIASIMPNSYYSS